MSYDAVNHTFVNGVWSDTEPSGNSVFSSPFVPDAEYPDTSLFPQPLDVQPGTPPRTTYPAGFKGGAGNWVASFVHP